jgi:hypothetical protein
MWKEDASLDKNLSCDDALQYPSLPDQEENFQMNSSKFLKFKSYKYSIAICVRQENQQSKYLGLTRLCNTLTNSSFLQHRTWWAGTSTQSLIFIRNSTSCTVVIQHCCGFQLWTNMFELYTLRKVRAVYLCKFQSCKEKRHENLSSYSWSNHLGSLWLHALKNARVWQPALPT